MLTVGSLFSGIGGLDLGLERAGMSIIWQSEIDPYASRVLAKHWPTVPNLGDIRLVNWEQVAPVDLICGGYPCQPFSLAGRRRGEDDSRNLWPFFADAIRVLRPRYALLENVPGHLRLGFDRVLADLAALRYDVVWDCLPASAVGAPHRRDRLFVVAISADADRIGRDRDAERHGEPERTTWREGDRARRDDAHGLRHPLPDSDGEQLRNEPLGERQREDASLTRLDGRSGAMADSDGAPRIGTRTSVETVFRPEAVERSRRRGRGERGPWATESGIRRVANGIPDRLDRLRCLGNAVVPQVAELLGELIIEHHQETPT